MDAVGGEGRLEGRLRAVGRPGDHGRPIEFGEVDGAVGKASTGCDEVVRVVEEFDVFDTGVVDGEVVEEQVDRRRVRGIHLVFGDAYVAAGDLVAQPADQAGSRVVDTLWKVPIVSRRRLP